MLSITNLQGHTEPLVDVKNFAIEEEILSSETGNKSLSFIALNTDNNEYAYSLIDGDSLVEYDGHEYRIKRMNESLNRKTVQATHVFFDLNKVRIDTIYEYKEEDKKTLNQAVNWVLESTGWTFENVDVVGYKELTDFGNGNVLRLLKELCSIFECEIQILPGKHLVFKKQIGEETDHQFRYKHNVQTISRHVDTSNNKPDISIEISETDLGIQTNLGDRVWVIYEPLNIELQLRIVAIKRKPLSQETNIVTLGSKRKRFIDYLASEMERKLGTTVTVGAEGDFQTLNDAMDYFINKPVYPSKATIRLLNDFVMNEQVIVENKKLDFITITSEQTVVVGSELSQTVRVDASPEFYVNPVFYGANSSLPTIDVLFSFEGEGENSSGMLLDNSTVLIKPNKGFTRFSFIGLCLINGSHATAHHGVFDENGNRDELTLVIDDDPEAPYEGRLKIEGEYRGDGVRCWNSTFSGSYATAHRCGDIGFHFTQGSQGFINKAQAIDVGHHALSVTTGSTCAARECVFTDTLDDCVVAYAGSKIDLRDSDVSGAVVNYGLIVTRSSEVNFERGIANNCGYSGIMANRGSIIDATDAVSNGSKVDGIRCANASMIEATRITILNAGQDGIHCTHGSIVQARLCNIDGSKRNGVLAFLGQVYVNEGAIINSGRRSIECTRGGYVSAHTCDLSGAGEKGVLAYGSEVYCSFSTINNSGDRGIEATQGGRVTAEGCTIDGSGDKGVISYASDVHLSRSIIRNSVGRSVEATQGGRITANEVEVVGIGNSFSVYNGGTIYAYGSYGTANRDLNTQTVDGLIMSDTLIRGN